MPFFPRFRTPRGRRTFLPPLWSYASALAATPRTRSPPHPPRRTRQWRIAWRPHSSKYANLRCGSAIPRHDMPGLCVNDSRPKKPEGAGNAGRPLHPQPRVQTWDFSTAPQTYYLNITGNSNNFSGFGVVGSAANITNNAFTFFSNPITLNANLVGATYTNNGTIWVGEGSAQTANITNSANLVNPNYAFGLPVPLAAAKVRAVGLRQRQTRRSLRSQRRSVPCPRRSTFAGDLHRRTPQADETA